MVLEKVKNKCSNVKWFIDWELKIIGVSSF